MVVYIPADRIFLSILRKYYALFCIAISAYCTEMVADDIRLTGIIIYLTF